MVNEQREALLNSSALHIQRVWRGNRDRRRTYNVPLMKRIVAKIAKCVPPLALAAHHTYNSGILTQ